jgi:hypothetical protein
VVGGKDPDTNELRRDIWWRDVTGGAWRRVSDGDYQPEKVLAATRPYRDGKLWILDEVRLGWLRFGRLVRLDPDTGKAELLGKWPRLGWFDRHWFMLDLEGNVVVVASSRGLKSHALMRIRLDGAKPRVDRVQVGQGELAMAPWVDVSGYALPIARKGMFPTIVRRKSLAGRQGAWSDMQGLL